MASSTTGRAQELEQVATIEGFVLLLNDVRSDSGLSLREVARRARAAGHDLPTSTVWDMLSRSSLPRIEALRAYLLACGVPTPDIDGWLATRRRLARRPATQSGFRYVEPRQLPHRPFGFAGRRREMAVLDALLDGGGPAERPGLVIVSGQPGVGKTALAVHWAHSVADRFPDGQLYVDLNGAPGRPESASLSALQRVLTAIGASAGQVPQDLDQAATLFRSMVAGRRVLLVLDNARSADEVRPLLPGGAGCLTIVTARQRLAALVATDGARPLPLDLLDADEAIAVLSAALPGILADGQIHDARELADICDRLPLALRVAAATLAVRPGTTLSRYVAELRDGSRMQRLRVPGDDSSPVAGAFDEAYRALPDELRAAFRVAGLVPGRDFDAQVVAAAVAGRPDAASDAIDRLADRHLLVPASDGRFAMHDLLREYAVDLSRVELAAEARLSIVHNIYDWYFARLLGVAGQLYSQMILVPGPQPQPWTFPDRPAAVAWAEREKHNLEAAVRTAAAAGVPEYAWRLADAMRGLLMAGSAAVNWTALGEAARAAAADSGAAAQAAIELLLGTLRERQAEPRLAIEHFTRALDLGTAGVWPEAVSSAHDKLGVTYSRLGRPDLAADHLRKGLRTARMSGRRGAEGIRLNNLATVFITSGRLHEARLHLQEAMQCHREAGTQRGLAQALNNLALVDRMLGLFDAARHDLDEAWTLHREVGNLDGEAAALIELAELHCDLDHLTEALPFARLAALVARRSANILQETGSYNSLARVHKGLNRLSWAQMLYERALRMGRTLATPRVQLESLIGLAQVTAYSAPDSAKLRARSAAELARRTGYPIFAGRAQAALAEAYAAAGNTQAARRSRETALEIFRETGYRPDLYAGSALAAPISGSPSAPTGRMRVGLHPVQLFGAT